MSQGKTALIPCASCARHVRVGASIEAGACPFCGAALPAAVARKQPSVRLGRAALMAFGSAALLPGCYLQHELEPSTGRDAGSVVVSDAARPDARPVEVDSGEPVAPPYGAPFLEDAGPEDDAGAVINAYGAPAFDPDDAGTPRE